MDGDRVRPRLIHLGLVPVTPSTPDQEARMSRASILGLAALGPVLLACAGPGAEAPAPAVASGGNQPQGFACPPVGAVLTMDDGTVTHFLGAVPGDPEICRFSSTAGPPEAPPVTALYGLWNANSEQAAEARAALRTLFPPASGKSAHFDVPSISEFVWRITYTVKGRQTLAVPAGRFEVWLIEYEQRGVVGNTFLGRQTFALADNGMIIRREGTVVRGRAPAGSGFVTPPTQAVSIRMP
jgi:hypothetical protein